MRRRGHPIDSHMWTHIKMDMLTQQERLNQMRYNKNVLAKALDAVPAYMRPPFGLCSADCLRHMASLAYHIAYWSVGTKDFEFTKGNTYHEAMRRFDADLDKGGSVVLSHGSEQYTANKLVPHMIAELKKRGLQGATLGECLGDPEANWHQQTLCMDGTSHANYSNVSRESMERLLQLCGGRLGWTVG